ncbi:MAG: hypothetical protein JSV70_07050 [bacterium]|nr:MAG: hypothetical protein JSV70_07050 [bacterium]
MASPDDIKQENRKIRALRILTDLTFQRLCLERMTLSEAREAIHDLRRTAVNMFPGKGEVFDLVIAPRLDRVILERFGQATLTPN